MSRHSHILSAVGLLALFALAAPRAGAAPPTPVVAAFGDSLTEGFPFLNDPWIDRLEPPFSTLNLGLSGERSADGLVRLQSWLAANPGVADVVVIMEGTNDTDESGGNPPYVESQTVANLVAMVAAVSAYGARPVLMAPPPVPADAGATAKLAALAPLLQAEAAKTQTPFVDLFDAFQSAPGMASLYHGDGIHLSDAGNQFVADRLLPGLQSLASPELPALGGWPRALAAAGLLLKSASLARRRCGDPAAPEA